MIVAKNNYASGRYAVYGNHALDNDNYNDYINTKEKTKINNRKKHIKQVKQKLKLLMCVFLMLSVGLFIVGRYAIIMNLNSQSRTIKANIVKSQKTNESLKMGLSTYCDIKQIEKVATTEMNMIHPLLSNTIKFNNTQVINNIDGGIKVSQDKISVFIGRVLHYLN